MSTLSRSFSNASFPEKSFLDLSHLFVIFFLLLINDEVRQKATKQRLMKSKISVNAQRKALQAAKAPSRRPF